MLQRFPSLAVLGVLHRQLRSRQLTQSLLVAEEQLVLLEAVEKITYLEVVHIGSKR